MIGPTRRASVSVAISYFNAASTMAETIRSTRSQALAPLEIVMVDGRSTDDTVPQARGFGVPMRVVVQKSVRPAAARNAGLASCRGDYVAFLEADGLWHPEKQQREVGSAEAEGGEPLVRYLGSSAGHKRSDPHLSSRESYRMCHKHVETIVRQGLSAFRNSQRRFKLYLVCGIGLFRWNVHDAARKEFARARCFGRFDWTVCCNRLANHYLILLINMLRSLLPFRPFSSRRSPT